MTHQGRGAHAGSVGQPGIFRTWTAAARWDVLRCRRAGRVSLPHTAAGRAALAAARDRLHPGSGHALCGGTDPWLCTSWSSARPVESRRLTPISSPARSTPFTFACYSVHLRLLRCIEARPVLSRARRPKRDHLHPEEETNVRIAEFSRSLGSTSLVAEFAWDMVKKERR